MVSTALQRPDSSRNARRRESAQGRGSSAQVGHRILSVRNPRINIYMALFESYRRMFIHERSVIGLL